MKYKMRLRTQPFNKIYNGLKTIELRLFDDKRSMIKIEDVIRFELLEESDKWIEVKVKELFRFDTFEELYATLPLEKLGYTEDNKEDANYMNMRQYYTEEDEKKYGVLAIEFEVVGKSISV